MRLENFRTCQSQRQRVTNPLSLVLNHLRPEGAYDLGVTNHRHFVHMLMPMDEELRLCSLDVFRESLEPLIHTLTAFMTSSASSQRSS